MKYWIRSKIGIITLVVGLVLVLLMGYIIYKYVLDNGEKPVLTIDNSVEGTEYLMELAINTKLEQGIELTDEERDFYNKLKEKQKEEAGGWVELDNGYSREELVFQGEKESPEYDGVIVTMKNIKAIYEKGNFRYVEIIYDIENKKEEEIYVTYSDLQLDNVKFEKSGAEIYVQPSTKKEFGVMLMINDKLADNFFEYEKISGTLNVNIGEFEYGEPVIKETFKHDVVHYRK